MIWALVPTKSFSRAKTRLTGVLNAPERAKLAEALFRRTVEQLRAQPIVDGVGVTTECPVVSSAAKRLGCNIVCNREPHPILGDIIDQGIRELPAQSSVIVLMSDLPRLGANDLAVLTAELNNADVTLCPDRTRDGTNVLGLRAGVRFPTRFGNRRSFALHQHATRRLGLQVRELLRPGLAFDLDGPADWQELSRDRPSWL